MQGSLFIIPRNLFANSKNMVKAIKCDICRKKENAKDQICQKQRNRT